LKAPPNHYDAAWKLVIERLFRPFLEMLFPPVAALVDWSRKPKFLDGQLQSILPEGEPGEMRADKLVEVGLKDGGSALLLIHVEVQAQRDPDLARRMFRYHYRLFDKFGRAAASLVVLADDEPGWRPGPYVHEAGTARLTFDYVRCKLLDVDVGPWLAAGNPVARVVEAHRAAQRTRGDVGARRAAKLALLKELLGAGLERGEALEVMRVVHWLLALPREEEVGLMKEVKSWEASMQGESRSPYETVVLEAGIEEGHRRGLEEGRQEGMTEGQVIGRCAAAREILLDVLAARFGACDESLVRAVEILSDAVRLRQLAREAMQASSLADFRRGLTQSHDTVRG